LSLLIIVLLFIIVPIVLLFVIIDHCAQCTFVAHHYFTVVTLFCGLSIYSIVKDQKVECMKKIKRLGNEKTAKTKQFKEYQEINAKLKPKFEIAIKRYSELQSQYDQIEEEIGKGNTDLQDAGQDIATEMIVLLQQIEEDRQQYTEKREEMKRINARCSEI